MITDVYAFCKAGSAQTLPIDPETIQLYPRPKYSGTWVKKYREQHPIIEVMKTHFPGCITESGTTCPECGGPAEITGDFVKCAAGCNYGRPRDSIDIEALARKWTRPRWIAHHIAHQGGLLAPDGVKTDSPAAKRHAELVAAALSYAGLGWRTVPINTVLPNGKCSCKRDGCTSQGKHPRLAKWQDEASADPGQIAEWWNSWGCANGGIATGPESGIFVLDVDGDVGAATLAAWIAEHGELPPTPMQITGSGGRHYVFKFPTDRTIPNSARTIGAGLDIRGTGGQIVAAPSNHKSGRNYAWADGLTPWDVPPADSPGWLLDLITKSADAPAPSRSRTTPQPAHHHRPSTEFRGATAGERNDAMYRHLCSVRERGGTDDVIRTRADDANLQCTPPVDRSELDKIVESVCKFPVGTRRTAQENPAAAQIPVDEAEKIVTDAIDKCSETPEIFVRNDVLRALITVERDRPELWVRVLRELKRHVLTSVVKKHMKRLRVIPAGERIDTTVFDELQPRQGDTVVIPVPTNVDCTKMRMPNTWGYRNGELVLVKSSPDGGHESTVVAQRIILPVRLTRDLETGNEGVEILHLSRDKWRSITLERRTAVDGRALIAAADSGLPVGSANASMVARYILEFIVKNGDVMAVKSTTQHMGWLPRDRGFIWGTEFFGAAGVDPVSCLPPDAGDRQFITSCHAAGTIDDWSRVVSLITDSADFPWDLNPHGWYDPATVGDPMGPTFLDALCVDHPTYDPPVIAVLASFTAPMLQILDVPSFAVDISGRTSRGKTISLRVAASVWGRPSESAPNGFLSSWDSTNVSCERLAAIKSDLPLILDDSQRAPRPQQLGATVYKICHGVGRTRASIRGSATTSHWRTILISSGESRLVSFSAAGGTRGRVWSITDPPFGGAPQPALVREIDETIQGNYGLAGPAFVKWLVQNRNRWDEFRSRFLEYRTLITALADDELGIRTADHAAAMMTTADLVAECPDIPVTEAAAERWKTAVFEIWGKIQVSTEPAHMDERGLIAAFEYAVAHRGREFRPDGTADATQQGEPPSGWAGRWDAKPNWEFIAWIPSRLREMLERGGYSYDGCLHGWRDRGWIQTESGRMTCSIRINGRQMKMVCIHRSAFVAAGCEPDTGAGSAGPTLPQRPPSNVIAFAQ